jgi:hypothetical protein
MTRFFAVRLAVLAVCLTLLGAPQRAEALRKNIENYDGIEQIATLSNNGRTVRVPISGDTAAAEHGLRTEILVAVYQEDTGAFALGRDQSPFPIEGDEIPERLTADVVTHAIGPDSFLEGWVTVTYFAEEIRNGNVTRSWSRTAEVLLLME